MNQPALTYEQLEQNCIAGRFMEEWADPRALQALPATFARYDGNSLRGPCASRFTFYVVNLPRTLIEEPP